MYMHILPSSSVGDSAWLLIPEQLLHLGCCPAVADAMRKAGAWRERLTRTHNR